jgi:hypothetical protein
MALKDFKTDAGVVSYGSQIGLNTEAATPPIEAYVGVNDQVYIMTSTPAGGITVTVDARLLMADGSIVPNTWSFVAPAQRAGYFTLLNLPECFILTMTIRSQAAYGDGQFYTGLYISRGYPSITFLPAILAKGYVSSNIPLNYPDGFQKGSQDGQGYMRIIQGTTPGAGVDITETVPSNARWRLHSFGATLQASAAVGNRNPRLVFDDGVSTFHVANVTQVITANQQYSIYLAPAYSGQNSVNATGITNNQLLGPIDLYPGWRMLFKAVTDVADQWTAVRYLVQEWLMP